MQTRLKLLVAATLSCANSLYAASLLPPQSGDLAAKAAVVPAAPAAMKAEAAALPVVAREPVSLSWASPEIAAVAPAPFVARSKESYTTVTADELAAGVPLHTTAPRALVRVQALSTVGPREQAAIHPQSMTVIDPKGRAMKAGEGMEAMVTADKLAKADIPFAEGTSAFRLQSSLGAGEFKLKVEGASGSDRYLVNVVEPDSPYTLTMQTGALHYLHGNELVLQAALETAVDGAKVKLSQLTGDVVSPAGRHFPVSFKADSGGRMRATLTLDADETPTPGLWEISAEGTASAKGQTVKRSIRLAFPVAMPVARLTRSAELTSGTGVNLAVGVEAATAGRYEVRGVLYGTVKGALTPLGVADSAQWLEQGTGSIALNFAPELIANATGPFELRELFLLDQGRLGVLHHQQRAMLISEAEVVRAGGRAAVPVALGGLKATAEPVRVKQAPNAQSSPR